MTILFPSSDKDLTLITNKKIEKQLCVQWEADQIDFKLN